MHPNTETPGRPSTERDLNRAMLGADVGRAFSEQVGMHAMLQTCAESIVRRLSVSGVHIWIANVENNQLEAPLCAGTGHQRYVELTGDHLRASEIGWIAEHCESLVVQTVADDTRFGESEWFERSGICAFAGFPLTSCGRLLGVIAVLASSPLPEPAVHTLSMVSTQMAMALHRDMVLRSHQETSQTLLALTRNSPASIVCMDRLRRVTQWNPAAESLFGWTREDVIGTTLPVMPPAQETWERALASALGGKECRRLASVGARKDGSMVALYLTAAPLLGADGAVRGAIAIATDRSDQEWSELCRHVQQQATLTVSQAKDLGALAGPVLRTICEAFGWACGEMWIVDELRALVERVGSWHRGGRERELFESFSPAMSSQRGNALPLWMRQDATVEVTDVRQHSEAQRAAALVRSGLNHVFEVPVRLGGRTLGAMAFFAADMKEPDRQLRGVMEMIALQIGQFIDRKKTEAKLRQTETEFHQTQKMESLGHLAGGIAHDFNNLLTVILGFSELATDLVDQDGPLHEMLREIHDAGDRASALTRQLLAFSRKQALQPIILDLNKIIAGMQRMLQRLIGENLELVTTLEPLLYRIKADPAQIEQVILNLAVNARDAMAEGGRLHIETSNVERLPKELRNRSDMPLGPCVRVTVTDTGCGMDESTRQRVFEPFFTTKEAGKGTGMGLATIHGIVKQSGGHIEVESAPGQGTRFIIYLPRSEELLATSNVEGAVPHEPGGTETILVAEDEPFVRSLVCRILRARGYQVLEAVDGAQARELCRRHRRPIHLLLTDVVMPALNGIELARELTASNRELKVLFMSGYTDSELLAAAEREWSRPLLQKPFTSTVLTQRVRETLDQN